MLPWGVRFDTLDLQDTLQHTLRAVYTLPVYLHCCLQVTKEVDKDNTLGSLLILAV